MRDCFWRHGWNTKRAFHLESKLLNQPWEEGVLRASSDSLKKDFTPLSDLRSSSEYRQTSAHNLLLRCYYETLGSNTNVQRWNHKYE